MESLRPRLAIVASPARERLLSEALVEYGYRVLCVQNGRELFWGYLAYQFRDDVAIVIADLDLPEYSTLEVIEAWASADTPPHVTLLGHCTVDERRRADVLGATISSAASTAPVLGQIQRWGKIHARGDARTQA